MDPNNPWNWGQGSPYGFPPPMGNNRNQYPMYGMPYGISSDFNPGWNQGANQQFPFQPTQPRLQAFSGPDAPGPWNNNNRRRRGQGDSYRPDPRPGGSQYTTPRQQRRSYRPGPQGSRPASDTYRPDESSGPSRSRSRGRPSGSARQDDRPGPSRQPPARSWRSRDGEALASPLDNLHLSSTSTPSGGPSTNPSQDDNQPTSAITNHNPIRHRDAITPPSAASGGIPEPTPAYLEQSSLPPAPVPSPQPILVVIDLNGTLLHRPRPSSPTHFIERPGASLFLRHCVAHHTVVVWSSAQGPNVARMCAQLLPPEILSRVAAVWGRDRFGLTPADYRRRTQCYKRLTRLWADPAIARSHPVPGGAWTQANTVLIDDSAEKARSEPHNAITVPEFGGGGRGHAGVEPEDAVLARVEEYLDTLTWQMDVSAYIRHNPFTMEQQQEEQETASPVAKEEEGQGEREDVKDGDGDGDVNKEK